jgi:hypothetical protein
MPAPRHVAARVTGRSLALVVLAIGVAGVGACASAASPSTLEPRFVAVHNTLAAMGLAQVGPLRQGALAQGAEARTPVDLAAGCTTVVVFGADGIRNVDASLVDPAGKPVAHDTTEDAQAVLELCIDAPATYALVVRAAAGSGSWLAAAWQGAGTRATASAGAPVARTPNGSCEAPIVLSAGTVGGDTRHGEDVNTGSCERSDAREIVYELDVTQRQRVTLEVEAQHFDSILYVRKDACNDPDAEVDCNDDMGSSRDHSRIERVLDPGKYFVFVDGYNNEAGPFKLTVSTTDVVSRGDTCGRAPALLAGSVSGTTRSHSDDAEASCGGGALGADAAWRLEVPSRSRVRLVERSTDVSPVLHVRHACIDERSESACSDVGAGPGEATVTGVFDAGSYAVFADARDRDAAGDFTLSYETSPLEGTGVAGDGCGDALPLPAGASSVSGDTFAARSDVPTSCGGAGAADVVYAVDVPRRSRLLARVVHEEGSHLLSLLRHCGDRGTEITCRKEVDEVLAPGTYFLAVQGASAAEAAGRFELAYSLEDLSGQSLACAGAQALVPGQKVTGTTDGAGDRFAASCSTSRDAVGTGPERLFRLQLQKPSTVSLTLAADAFDASLSLRRACADAPGAVTELDCRTDGDDEGRISLSKPLPAGTYWVVVEGRTPNDAGRFTLTTRLLPP